MQPRIYQSLQFWVTQSCEWHFSHWFHRLTTLIIHRTPSLFHSRLKPPFSANPSHRSLAQLGHDIKYKYTYDILEGDRRTKHRSHEWLWYAGNHGKTCTVASIDELRPYVCNFATNKKGIKGYTRLPSVGFRSWSRFLAVSLQVTWVINPTVGCHYFPPGL